jgi:hypothetical protein
MIRPEEKIPFPAGSRAFVQSKRFKKAKASATFEPMPILPSAGWQNP